MVSISFSIGAGRFYEEDQVLGLSHLLEHCIFAPNKSFPQIGQLTEFIDNNGGDINAWTDDLSTNFHLLCPISIALQAIEMLASKLLFPVFDKQNVGSEITAIDAEFSSKKSDEIRRLTSVQKSMCSQTHPYNRFSMGNRHTLTALPLERVISQLASYHQRHFVSNNMSVAMSLPDNHHSEMKKTHQHIVDSVEDLLATFPTNNEPLSPAKSIAFKPLFENQLISIKSRVSAIIISIILDKHRIDAFDNLALTMFETVLSSRHVGGFIDVAKTKYDILDFSIKHGFEDARQAEVQLCFSLTHQLSKTAIVDLYRLFKDYIAFISVDKLPQWRFREKQRQIDLQHSFAKRKNVLDRTVELAEVIRMHADTTNCSFFSLDSSDVQNRFHCILKQIKDQKLPIYALTGTGDFDRKTDHYNVEYAIEDVTLDQRTSQCDVRFNHAPQNTFLPSSLEVFRPCQSNSKSLSNAPSHYRWTMQAFRMDYWLCYRDNKPLGDIYVSFISKDMYGSDSIAVAKRIWLACVQDYLKTYFFQTQDAGLYFKVYGHQRGISVQTSGFTDRQLLLMYELLSHVTSFRISETDFQRAKHKVENKINRSLWQKPINKLFSSLSEVVHSSVIRPENLLHALYALEFTDFEHYQDRFFANVEIESLMVGNWPLILGDRLKEHIYKRFKPKLNDKDPAFTGNQTSTASYAFRLNHQVIETSDTDDQAFMLFQSFGETDKCESELRPIAFSLMIEAFLSPLFFVEMRNKRKVGYNLGVGYKPIEKHAGIVVYALSPNIENEMLKTQIIDGLRTVIQEAKTTGIDFASLQKLVCEQINQPTENASSLGRFIWLHFDNPEPLTYASALRETVLAMDEKDFWQNCEKLLFENEKQVILQTKMKCHEHEA